MTGDSPFNSFPPSSHKRLKTPVSNSNSKTVGETNQQEQQMSDDKCGICLTDYGQAIRGILDSCKHFFCFVCIMMWAKIESRCPTCKVRFTTIRRPPKPGVFLAERVVRVPKRDQIYHPLGNVSIGPFDPYADIGCRVCNGSDDESLLLLCDLCDSAAHTYCVGLGATVPEGDWFCHDCEITRAERQNSVEFEYNNLKADDDGVVVLGNESYVSGFDVVDNQQNLENSLFSIFDIVHESDMFTGQGRQRSPIAGEVLEPSEISTPNSVTQTRARSLSRCRNVNAYIIALRENWDALRSGSLLFSSSSVEPRCSVNASRKHSSVAIPQDQPHFSPSRSGMQLSTQDGLSGFSSPNRQSDDIKKAWKMMNRAKSIIYQSSKYTSCEGKPPKGEASTGLSMHLSKNKVGKRELGKETKREALPKSEKRKLNKFETKEIVESSDIVSATTYSPQFHACTSSCMVQTSSAADVPQENGTRLFHRNLCRASLHVTNRQNGVADLRILPGSLPRASDSSKAKPENNAPSSCEIDTPKGKMRLMKVCAKSKARYENAKSEVQSLVKLNLKLLSRDKRLEVNAFKEVARLATHTILAACGLGNSRHVIRSFPGSVCSHSEQIQQLRKSTLMPHSCRECFYIFVKDIVNSILSEKVHPAQS